MASEPDLSTKEDIANINLRPTRLTLKQRVAKVWMLFAGFALGGLAVLLVYVDGLSRGRDFFWPPEPVATYSDVVTILDERYVARRGSENQAENSLRLMNTLPNGFKRIALELVNTGDYDDALAEYREGYKLEVGEDIVDKDIWKDLKKIAATISPGLELACHEGSMRGRSIGPSERITYSFELKKVGLFNESLLQAKRALAELDNDADFEVYHRGLSAYNHALFTTGRYDEALKGYETAYAELIDRQDSKANKRSLASAISGLGLMAHKRGDYEGSIDYISREAAIWRELGHFGNFANAMSNLGRSARLAGDFNLAENAYNTAITVSLINDEHETLFRSLGGLNVLYDMMNHDELGYKTALFGAREARRIGLVEQEAVFLKDLVLTKGRIETKETVSSWIKRMEELSEIDVSGRVLHQLTLSKAVYNFQQGNYPAARFGFEKLPAIESSSAYNEVWQLGWLISIDKQIGDLTILCQRLAQFDVAMLELTKHQSFDPNTFSSAKKIREETNCK